ncbi:MAG: hypothetical protein E7679_04685 [Ruminococcaceae bacterium]|nr:hypothetical protein [Oscillospiraceae bacterium]
MGDKRLKHGNIIIDESTDTVRFLGYPIELTPKEYDILKTVIEQGHISTERLCELCGISGTKNNVAVHICKINEKAEDIGGRKLILYKDLGYYINEFM